MRKVRLGAAATGEMSRTAPRAMQPRTKWIVTVFIGLLLVGVAGRLYDTAGPSPVKEIPMYSGVAPRGFTPSRSAGSVVEFDVRCFPHRVRRSLLRGPCHPSRACRADLSRRIPQCGRRRKQSEGLSPSK